MDTGTTRIALTLLAALLSTACNPNQFSMNSGSQAPTGANESKTPEFSKLEVDVKDTASAVDIIFVVDNTSSMEVELGKIAANFGRISEKLAGRDWQACVTTTDWYTDYAALRIWSGTSSYVLNANTPALESVFTNTLKQITINDVGMPTKFQAGLRTANWLFANAGKDEVSHGCLRQNAGKAVIVVSDEDELIEGWTRGDLSVAQPMQENLPTTLSSTFNSQFTAGTPFVFNTIGIHPDDKACLESQRRQPNDSGASIIQMGYPGIRYNEVVKATRGDFVSICEADYSAPLSKLGEKILSTLDSVDLPCPGDARVDHVDFTGTDARQYEAKGNKVIFKPALTNGMKATVYYQCL